MAAKMRKQSTALGADRLAPGSGLHSWRTRLAQKRPDDPAESERTVGLVPVPICIDGELCHKDLSGREEGKLLGSIDQRAISSSRSTCHAGVRSSITSLGGHKGGRAAPRPGE
eukprot:5892536-Pyramimonas_sp.AAC.1